MKISEQFIASLLARIDLVDLVGKTINLRLVGANFIGLCPFHQEKTPSFTVNKVKQFFYCFGCKESGDAIRFSMLIKGHNFVESVQYLANEYGLRLEQDHITKSDPLINEIYKILDLAVDYYHQELLKNHPEAIAALNYLINDRKISLNTIRHFKLGLANKEWTTLLKFFQNSNKNSNNLQLLEQAGLIITKNGESYDRFMERIIFPIRNRYAQTIGFGGRALSDEQTPKYINSPETIVFSKNKELYGLEEVKSTLKNFNNLIIVEGYLDVLSLFQAEIVNVVATLGTALNSNHIKTVLSIVPEIIFCFDGDLAGNKAAIKAMQISLDMLSIGALHSKHSIKFGSLPKGYDPDLLVKEKGNKEFKQLIAEAKVLSDFFFDYLLEKYPEKTIEDLNKLANDAKTYITKFKDIILKNLWYEKLAKILGIDSSLLKIEIDKKNKNIDNINHIKNLNYKQIYHKKNYITPISTNANKAICMLLVNPKLLSLCEPLEERKLNDLKSPLPSDIDLFMKIINFLRNKGVENYTNLGLNVNLLSLDNYNKIINELALIMEPMYMQKLLSMDPVKMVQLIPLSGMEQEFVGAVKQVNKVILKLMLDDFLIISKERNLTNQEKLYLQQILKEL